jgi:hypothetical protein
MYKIKIFCPFASSSKCKEVYEKISYANEIDFYGKDKKVYITDDDDDYTHAIIINTAKPDLKIQKKNVIGLAFEPIQFLGLTFEFIEYAQKYIGKYYIGDKLQLPEPFVEHFGYMWYSRPPKEITHKPNLMSIVVSNKRFAPGHIYRHNLIEKIIELSLPIDIYGYGSDGYSKYNINDLNYTFNRIKGNFNDAEPYENYLYSICIENFQCNDYFSEKIITPLLHNCMPIYLGCKNIDKYFDSIIKLTGNINKDILLIIDIIRNPFKYYNNTYNEKNIKRVNLIENIEKLYS